MDWQFIVAFINIIIIDLVLSGDNAVVVGMASRNLPPGQRKKAILWGTAGAVGLRLFFTALATWLLGIPYIKLIGGLLLVWIAFKLLLQQEEASSIQSGKNTWDAVKIIIIADFIMSLDNVLAIGGAAKGSFGLIVFGLLLSVPLLMWGSSIVAKWMNEYPILTYFGSGVLAYTAATMVMEDPLTHSLLQEFNVPGQHILLPLTVTGIVIIFGKIWRDTIVTIHRLK
ncbi:TerC family protein [Ammoniphilus sp. CFH 90114]|uniref:TerC family protein n=1 Tax=Ammoniphilus sp. CFH 90114 TaxID=2493665 RepID=UPI00100EA17F|nr:TerC family protein [Ammoniphilus sp. CFH 90114]RXT13572.1 TerC family protein [Ammoniphilus sp. CFH 90114]